MIFVIEYDDNVRYVDAWRKVEIDQNGRSA
jgi:hypothetical protein